MARRSLFTGGLALTAALGAVAVMLYAIPATRVFLLISVPLAVVVAVFLHFWNQRPVKLTEEENKRPLGLE